MPSPLSRLTRTYERSFKRNPSLTLAIANACLKCLGDFLAQLLPSLASGQPFVFDVHRSLRFLMFGFLHGPCVGKWHEFLEHRIPLTAQRPNQAVFDADLPMIEAEKSLSVHPTPAGAVAVTPRPAHPSVRSRSVTDPVSIPTLRTITGSDGHLLGLGTSTRKTRSMRFWGVAKRLLLDQLVMAPLYTFVFISLTAWLEGLSIPAIKERLDQLYWYILTANWKIWPLIQVINFNFMPLQYRVPWQGSCGVLWTVFLSLSTHSKPSSSHIAITTTGAATTMPSLISSGSSSVTGPPGGDSSGNSTLSVTDNLTKSGNVESGLGHDGPDKEVAA